MGSDDEVGTTGESQQKMNKAIQKISAKRRAAAIAKDYGAVTDTDGLVRIMGCDPFRRPGISPCKTGDSNK